MKVAKETLLRWSMLGLVLVGGISKQGEGRAESIASCELFVFLFAD